MNRFDNLDCMIGMKEYPDKYFDLAIVDPPYGIGATGMNLGYSVVRKKEKVNSKDWDKSAPDQEYFSELFRVSENQIIWGANHYIEKFAINSKCWVVWYKNRNNNDFADCELAWTSFESPVRLFQFDWNGFSQGYRGFKEERIHINQKPIALYKWLLDKYAKPNDKILDTHVGSASSLIACEDLGFEYVGFELDKDYYEAAQKRLEQFRSQYKLAI